MAMPDTAAALLVEQRGPLLVMTINRPTARNALTTDVTTLLTEAIERLETDPSLRVGVLSGAGGGFCAGIDLKAFASSGSPTGLKEMLRDRSVKPMVAAVEGFALGGGLELALMCDLIVAARGTKLGLPEAKFGLLAAGGALFRIPERLVTSMVLTGTPLIAEEAADHGLVARLTDPGQALAEAIELATAIAANAPLPIAAALRLIRSRAGRSEEEMWAMQVPERDTIFTSSDAREGALAFSEKRVPSWAGK
jgi:enoyl-CoA hydratase